MGSSVQLEHVSKAFGPTRVLDDVSLTIAAGSTVVLIGPSGCGKSTLLRLIAGLLVPDEGSVAVGSHSLSADTVSQVRQELGYVIQDGGLFPHLTALQNITLAARFQRWTDARMQQRVGELLELTHFPSEGLQRYPAQLSGGQKQRVGLMRALMTDPEVLLLDEPLAALDPMIRFDLQSDLRAIFRTLQKTVILVTHDLHEAAWFGEQIVLMRSGRIEQQGSAQQLVQSPKSAFVSDFVRAQRVTDFGAAS